MRRLLASVVEVSSSAQTSMWTPMSTTPSTVGLGECGVEAGERARAQPDHDESPRPVFLAEVRERQPGVVDPVFRIHVADGLLLRAAAVTCRPDVEPEGR